MKIFSKTEKWEKPFSEKVYKRVKKIPTADLSLWAEQAISELGRTLSTFEKSRSEDMLKEALLGAEAVHAVIDELFNRTTRL